MNIKSKRYTGHISANNLRRSEMFLKDLIPRATELLADDELFSSPIPPLRR